MISTSPLDPHCPACTVNEYPPPQPADAYIAAVVEMETDSKEVLSSLCKFHEQMRLAFIAAARSLEELKRKLEEENPPSNSKEIPS